MNISQSYIFRYDSIFLIARIDYGGYDYGGYEYYYHDYQYEIFGISETNSALQLKSNGVFLSQPFLVKLRFPQVITAMRNRKYLVYPQSIHKSDDQVKVLRIDVEEWHYNEGLTRSPINFPVNFTDEQETLWIFKT